MFCHYENEKTTEFIKFISKEMNLDTTESFSKQQKFASDTAQILCWGGNGDACTFCCLFTEYLAVVHQNLTVYLESLLLLKYSART